MSDKDDDSKTDDKDDDKADKSGRSKVVHDPKKWKLFYIVGAVSLVLDQVTKIWARASLPVIGHGTGANGHCQIPDDIIHRMCGGQPVTVINGYWEWRLSMNPGSAFGLFGGIGPEITRWFLSAIGIAAVFGMIMMMRRAKAEQKVLHLALALVAGGAVGNLIDRVIFSVVTDFVLWKYKTHEWPVFNVADVVLVVGVILMFFDIGGENKKEKLRKKKAREKARERARAAGLVKD